MNGDVLDAYAACKNGAEVIVQQNTYMQLLEREANEIKHRSVDLPKSDSETDNEGSNEIANGVTEETDNNESGNGVIEETDSNESGNGVTDDSNESGDGVSDEADYNDTSEINGSIDESDTDNDDIGEISKD